MRVLFHSISADSLGIAYRIRKEGHQVFYFIKDDFAKEAGDGMIEKVSTMAEGMSRKPGLVIFDREGSGDLADRIRATGVKVLGGSAWADEIELDREAGMRVARDYGIKIPETEEFSSATEAVAYIKRDPKATAIKIYNNKSEISTYVSRDGPDMIDYLEYQTEVGEIKEGNKFLLQEVIDGAEISTEMWFSDGFPVWPANSTFETKKFMAGELGERTGSETSLVFHYQGTESKLVNQTLRKIFPLLRKIRYTGALDANCIVSEKDKQAYLLEWTPRIGYSAIYALAEMLGTGIGDFFYRIAYGRMGLIPFRARWGSALKLSIPPYPAQIEGDDASHKTYKKSANLRIKGALNQHFWPVDAKIDQRGRLVTAGVSGVVGECGGSGNSITEAWVASQKVFKGVEIPNGRGRYTDGASEAWRRAKRLKEMGYEIPVMESQVQIPVMVK